MIIDRTKRLIELINIRNQFTALMTNNDVGYEAYKQIRNSADLLLRVDLGIIKIY